jgi:DNA-binding transcriptional ArsR family regulator
MADWNFLTIHGRALLCIANDPGVRLRDIADRLSITERTAYGIVTDLTKGGYVTKDRDGRRNRYEIQAHLPIKEAVGRDLTIGEVLDLFVEPSTNEAPGRTPTTREQPEARP